MSKGKNLLIAADNFQILNRSIERAVSDLEPEAVHKMINRCIRSGADAVDINVGPMSRDSARKMTFLMDAIQETTDLPILLDTSNPSAMKAGLEASRKSIIINGFSLEPRRLAEILPLAKQFDADIIGYLLYPNGHVPPDASERFSLAVELFHHILEMDIDPARLIIDPVLVPLTWANGAFQAKEILTVIRELPNLLDYPVKTIVGLSNLTTGKADISKKLQVEQVFLPMLASAGLYMVLMNVFHQQTVKAAKTCNMMLNPGIFTWEEVH